MAKDALIRVDRPFTLPPLYVKHVARDGGFSVTHSKERARRFTLATAADHIRGFANTRMQFSVIDAPGAA